MNMFLTILTILLSSILSFLVGYAFRKYQEEKMKRRVWSNVIKRIHMVPPMNFNLTEEDLSLEDEQFGLVDSMMYDHPNSLSEDDLENLKNELKVALLVEDYEKAARIRDLLRGSDL